MAGTSESSRIARARVAFTEALARIDRGEHLDVAELVRARPELERELRALHTNWQRIERWLDVEGSCEAPEPRVDDTASTSCDGAQRLDPGRSRYEVRELVARGGMGSVWRVFDRVLERELALKRSHFGDVQAKPREAALARRFLAEARLTSGLDHPSIVPVYDVGVDDDGELYFTMPLVRGSNFDRVLDHVHAGELGWTPTRAIEVLLRVCDAVACAHAAGVVHRDLKPSNIMVGRFGETYVMDWGLARRIGTADAKSACRGDEAIVGTPAYMAPEQAHDADVGPRADVYALGAILYRLLSGEPPYARSIGLASGDDVLIALRAGPPPPIEALAPRASPELAAICARGMARDPSDRYASVGALSEDLRAWIEGRVVRAHETGAWPELRKWIQRNRRLAASLAISLALVIASLSWISYVEATSHAEILRLSDVRRLAELERRAELIWPAVPTNVAALEAWLVEARAITDNLPVHEATLHALESNAGESHDATTEERAWRRETLAALVRDLRALSAPGGTLASVTDRLDFARSVRAASIDAHASAWAAAIASIRDESASPHYRGLAIEPQLGLVPIGRDVGSGLWEFAHLASGSVPSRRDDGTLAVDADTAIVLVLAPGGTFVMGSERPTPGRPSGPRTDALARDDETPAHEVTLAPFFIAKHETSVAQWHRLVAWGARSTAPRALEDALLPVTGISAIEASRALEHAALALPTEAQWEYAARAGTTSRWWCGNDVAVLRRVANAGAGLDASLPYDDGFARTAPIDALAANPFGLFHVHGNASEWTRDDYTPKHERAFRASDGLATAFDPAVGSARGGSFASSILELRSAARAAIPRANRDVAIGVRAARALEP